jgi:hypothetical protein
MLADPRRGYLFAARRAHFRWRNPWPARAALEKAEFVVVMSPFKHVPLTADMLLPIAPFTETPGTFVHCEGRAQTFQAVVYPRAEARPAWKVLRVWEPCCAFRILTLIHPKSSATPYWVRDPSRRDSTTRPRYAIERPPTTPAPLGARRRCTDLFRRPAGAQRDVAATNPPTAAAQSAMHRALLDKLV